MNIDKFRFGAFLISVAVFLSGVMMVFGIIEKGTMAYVVVAELLTGILGVWYITRKSYLKDDQKKSMKYRTMERKHY